MVVREVHEALEEAAAALAGGGCIGLPTDTVYGLAAALSSGEAVARLAELKGRPPSVPIALLVADRAQAAAVADVGGPAAALAERHWPGPLTLVVPAAPGVARVVGSADGSVGVRCPDHPFVQAVARRVGPLAVTSANRHREPPATTAAAVARAFPSLALVVDGGRCDGVPSTVVDARVDPVVVLRRGAIEVA